MVASFLKYEINGLEWILKTWKVCWTFIIFSYSLFLRHTFQGLLEWTNFDQEKRKPFLKSFIDKTNLEEIAPQVLIEVTRNPVVSSDPIVETTIRDSLTRVLSRKFDSLNEQEPLKTPPSITRSYNQQDVSVG